jgi:hypothetical protein
VATSIADACRGEVLLTMLSDDNAVEGVIFGQGGGPTNAIEKCQGLFNALGQKTFVISEKPADANLVKLSGNFLIAATIESLGEAIALARKAGIDTHRFVEILTGTLGANGQEAVGPDDPGTAGEADRCTSAAGARLGAVANGPSNRYLHFPGADLDDLGAGSEVDAGAGAAGDRPGAPADRAGQGSLRTSGLRPGDPGIPAKLAETQVQQALAPILRQMGHASDPDEHRALFDAIQAIPAKLSEAQVQQVSPRCCSK